MEDIHTFHQLHKKEDLVLTHIADLLLLVPQFGEEVAAVGLIEGLIYYHSSVIPSSEEPLHEDGLVG